MLLLIFSFIFFASFVVSGYLSYHYIYIQENKILVSVFILITVLSLVATLIFFFKFLSKKKNDEIKDLSVRLKKWSNISYHASKAGDEAFNELPVGIILYDESYNITWSNGYARKIFNNQIIEDTSVDLTNIESLSKELLEQIMIQKDIFLYNYYSKSYDVIHNIENNILYFFEVTEREEIKKRYNDRITGVGIIEIDNLEESLKKFDMQEKANIRGQILGEVSDYIARYGCYLVSVSGDRMLIIIDQESLNKMMADKFSVLSQVRDISQKNRLKASISMGIACHDVEYDELGSIAQSAIELAEKRGGDQVVVNIQNKKIQFFGGNTNSLEKNTLVEARMQAMNLKEAVEGSSNVLIMCHNFADCDALGSMLGAYHMVSSSGIETKMVFDPKKSDATVNKIAGDLMKDPVISEYFITVDEALSRLKPTTLLLITDTQSPSLVMFKEVLERAQRISIIDHHRAGDQGYSNYLTYYVETSASSAVELITEMFMFYNPGITVSNREASIMLAGIIVDTNNFTMRSGTRTFEAAATLRSMGADMIFVRQLLQEPLQEEKMLAGALMKAELVENRFGIVCLGEDEKIKDRTTLAKISDRLLTISGIKGSFTIGRINENLVGVSARSLGDDINVQLIMETMGGGGHFNSAAVQKSGKTILEVKAELIEILKTEFADGGSEKVKVILTADVKGKGKKDDIIEVANGYANYLTTNNLAVKATPENLAELDKQKALVKKEAESKRNVLKKFRDEIDGKTITLKIKVGAGGKNFGHITTKLVCDEFEAQTGIHLDKKKVELPGELNSIGIFTATVKLDTDIVANFEIKVIEK